MSVYIGKAENYEKNETVIPSKAFLGIMPQVLKNS